MRQAISQALDDVESMLQLEKDAPEWPPSHQHSSRMMQSRPSAREEAIKGAKIVAASQKLAQK